MKTCNIDEKSRREAIVQWAKNNSGFLDYLNKDYNSKTSIIEEFCKNPNNWKMINEIFSSDLTKEAHGSFFILKGDIDYWDKIDPNGDLYNIWCVVNGASVWFDDDNVLEAEIDC